MMSKQEIISQSTKGIIADPSNADELYEIYDPDKLYELAVNNVIDQVKNILSQNNNLGEHYVDFICKQLKEDNEA